MRERDAATHLPTISASLSGVSQWEGSTFSTSPCRHRHRRCLASSQSKTARIFSSTQQADPSTLKYGSSMMVAGCRSESPWNYAPTTALSWQQWYVSFASHVVPHFDQKKIEFAIARPLFHRRKQSRTSSSRFRATCSLWRYFHRTSPLLPRANHHPHLRRKGRVFACGRRMYVGAFGRPRYPGVLCRRSTVQWEVG